MISETVLILLILVTITVGIAALLFLIRFIYRRFFLKDLVNQVRKQL